MYGRKIVRIFFPRSALNGSNRKTAEIANCSFSRVQQNKAEKFQSCVCVRFPGDRNRILTAFFSSAFSRGQDPLQKCSDFGEAMHVCLATNAIEASISRSDRGERPRNAFVSLGKYRASKKASVLPGGARCTLLSLECEHSGTASSAPAGQSSRERSGG